MGDSDWTDSKVFFLILEYAKENIKAQTQGLVERTIYRILTKVLSRRFFLIIFY